ncbi:VOC family protein [Citricoccus sp. SGAir0253]|uniref:VOC family protein n=1 Tax=Citricoccus sp. SGAir0253 TaxID=2567881 RepID=UPI0010CCD4DA|nr:VOC family protein [Citricoccus sp. SGAir0253]QCU77669.1 VOC family protein [Citricoccus sp. SGAir0253]
MGTSLATYITLPGTTAEAFEHWRDVFGGELDITRYGDMPPMEGMPFTPDPRSVAHVTLRLPGGELAGGDVMDGKDYPVRDTAYSLLYTLESPEEAEAVVRRLVDAGGTEAMPFGRAPWGGWYGQVFDRFGVMWALSVDGD